MSDVNALKWNIVATDTSGARRTLVTYTLPEDTTPITNDNGRGMALSIQGKINGINTGLGANDSAIFLSSDAGYTGNEASFGSTLTTKLGFESAGTLANASYASGLGFMRVDSAAIGSSAGVLNEYYDDTLAVNAWMDSSNTLHIGVAAPVPEADTYALMLAGLGLLGYVARRRRAA